MDGLFAGGGGAKRMLPPPPCKKVGGGEVAPSSYAYVQGEGNNCESQL